MFSEKSSILLGQMRISPDGYFEKIERKFESDAEFFCKLIEYFDSKDKIGSRHTFLNFWKDCETGYDCESEIFNWAYEFYNNLSRYFNSGVFGLFKFKQAEWGAPIVKITKDDVMASDVELLNNPQKIYRGLSKAEHLNKEYAQSWTLELSKAIYFAYDVYSDKVDGIVVEAMVQRKDIIYYDKNDSEQEVIIEFGAIKNAKILEC